ncbi:MAG: hypothetical protein HKN45_07475 [Flavobacteriales bacterium]|nr:hypothetical protein [Flavobacteriales bacterium]
MELQAFQLTVSTGNTWIINNWGLPSGGYRPYSTEEKRKLTDSLFSI